VRRGVFLLRLEVDADVSWLDYSSWLSLKKVDASPRHIGQVRLVLSHLSTHLLWNSWLHGRTLTTWRCSKSLMQTTQTVCSQSSPLVSLVYL